MYNTYANQIVCGECIHCGKKCKAPTNHTPIFCLDFEPATEERGDTDVINSPAHYRANGVQECIEIIEALGLNYRTGNAMKYLYRYLFKGKPLEDLKKARFYLDREIKFLEDSELLKHIPDDKKVL